MGHPAKTLVLHAPAPSSTELYCAWFGDVREGTLYFGMAPFWWALRQAGGDPTGDLRAEGPLPVGRFDLDRLAFGEPLGIEEPVARGGVWDVLVHPNGRIYFTTYFEPAGDVDPETGAVRRFPQAGLGLNELALGDRSEILATRYGVDPNGPGSVVVLDPDGNLLAEHVLGAPEGYRAAPKSIAFDPVRAEIWVNTDLLPANGDEIRHDVRILGPDGSERIRFERPEIQFMVFGPDGTGYFAERDGRLLRLRVRPAERAAAALLTGRLIPLDHAFPAELDFVQEIRPAPDGSVLVTRWSGRLHRVLGDGRVQDLDLPQLVEGGLYYTGVIHGSRVCATYCGQVTVVCRELP